MNIHLSTVFITLNCRRAARTSPRHASRMCECPFSQQECLKSKLFIFNDIYCQGKLTTVLHSTPRLSLSKMPLVPRRPLGGSCFPVTLLWWYSVFTLVACWLINDRLFIAAERRGTRVLPSFLPSLSSSHFPALSRHAAPQRQWQTSQARVYF